MYGLTTPLTGIPTHQIPGEGNLQIGFPRRDRCVALDIYTIQLNGPGIEVFHPREYNPLKYYCYNEDTSQYEVFNCGVAGLFNITTSSWLTNQIWKVSPTGSILYLNSGISAGDNLMIYYYARVNHNGGWEHPELVGDSINPAVLDTPIRVFNEAVPMHFGQFETNRHRNYHYKYYLDLREHVKNTDFSGTNDLILDTANGQPANTTMPIIVTGISVLLTVSAGPLVPDDISFRVKADGHYVIAGLDLGALKSNRYTRFWSTHPFYSDVRNPGSMGMVNNDLSFSCCHAASLDNLTMRFYFPLGELEVLELLKVYMDTNPVARVVSTKTYAHGYAPYT